METTPTAEQTAVDLDQIIRDLDTPWTGMLPIAAIRAAQAQRGVIVPRLIQAIQDATRQTRAGAPPERDAHFFALFLLTEFKAQEALPPILEAVSLPGDTPFDLYGDAVTETLRRILATLGAESLEAIDALISNPSLNEYVRWAAAGAYLYLVRDGRLTRDAAVARLRTHLSAAINHRDTALAEGLVGELISYSPHEAEAEIREAFRLDLVDTMMVDISDVERSLAEGNTRFQRELEFCRQSGIEDTVAELEAWASFCEEPERPLGGMSHAWSDDWGEEESDDIAPRDVPTTIRNATERVGRNDPYPCGSGKKFKKCCGAN